MIPLSRRCCRQTSCLFSKPSISTRIPYKPLRAYTTTQKQSSFKPPSKSTISPKVPPIPLQSVLPTKAPSTQISSSRINPPSSTHPPPLNLPSRTLQDGTTLPFYKYYYYLGKTFAKFYKTGLKFIWTNYRTARALPQNAWSKSPTALYSAVRAGTLSRADLQLIRRAKSDLWKVPPFALLFAICGEFTPLVIVFVTGLVPRRIWIPKQVEGARRKAEERRSAAKKDSNVKEPLSKLLGRCKPGSRSKTEPRKFIAQSLGLYPAWWDRYFSGFIPQSLVARRVDEASMYLQTDGFAINRDGGVESMNSEEVVLACEERGINVLGVEEKYLRDNLERWLTISLKRSEKS